MGIHREKYVPCTGQIDLPLEKYQLVFQIDREHLFEENKLNCVPLLTLDINNCIRRILLNQVVGIVISFFHLQILIGYSYLNSLSV